jgi:hypothetical protein
VISWHAVNRELNWVILYPFYVLLLPVLTLIWVGRRTPTLKRIAGRVLVPTTSLIAAPILLFVLMVVWLLQLTTESELTTLIFVWLATVVNTLILLACLRWAADPFRPFVSFVSLIDWLQQKTDLFPTKKTGSVEAKKAKVIII